MSVSAADFDFVRRLVEQRSAIALEPGKEYLVESRLLPVARSAGENGIAGLVSRLRTRPADPLADAVIDAMTTNETSWFRDRLPFESLRKDVLPALVERRRTLRSIKVWSAACSSGQEPYTVAITAVEALAEHPGFRCSILATDLADSMVQRTRSGRYSQLEVNRGLPAQMLVKYFRRAGTEWEVSDELRRMVEVRRHNLAEPLQGRPSFDIVFLRNVLIYFSPQTKRDVLARVRSVLAPDGYLVMGAAEVAGPGFTRLPWPGFHSVS